MKQRLLALLLSACLLVGLLPTAALAAETKAATGGEDDPWDVSAEGGGNNVTAYLRQNDSESTYTLVISGSGNMADFTDPTKPNVEDAKLAPWYSGLTANEETKAVPITQIEIGEQVTGLGDYAFAYTDVTTATFSKNVTNYGEKLFAHCPELTTVNWDNYNPERTKHAEIETNTEKFVSDAMFDGCGKLTTSVVGGNTYENRLVLPEDIVGMGYSAFYDAEFATVNFETDLKQIKYVGAYAFANNTALTELFVSKDIEYCLRSNSNGDKSANTFANATGLKNVEIEDGVTCIPTRFFSGCKFEEITLPDSIREIGDYAFSHNKFSELKLGAIEKIGKRAFENCENLKTVEIAGSKKLDFDFEVFNEYGGKTVPVETFTLLSASLIKPAYRMLCGAAAFQKDGFDRLTNVLRAQEIVRQYKAPPPCMWKVLLLLVRTKV